MSHLRKKKNPFSWKFQNQKQRKPLMLKFKILILQDLFSSKLHTRADKKWREHDKPSALNKPVFEMFKPLRLEIGLNMLLSDNAKVQTMVKLVAKEQRTRGLVLSRFWSSINLLPHSIYKKLGLEALTPTRMTLELANRSITHPMGIAEDVVVRVDGFIFLADFVVVNFEPDPRVPIIWKDFPSHCKSSHDFVRRNINIRVRKGRPFLLGEKTSDNFEKFADELAPLDSLPPGNDDSTIKKDFHEENFQVYSNPLFEFDDNFKSSNLFERDSIPPGIDLTLPPTLEVSSSNRTSPTLTGEKVCSWKMPIYFSLVRFVWKMMNRIAIRKNIICLLATYLHQKPKPFSQEVEEIKIEEDKVSSEIPIDTIVMPIRITFDNPIAFNDHFSKPNDFKKDLPISFDSTESNILPPPLLDSDSPFTAELSASVTLNSLGNEDKVFKPGILVYHAIHDKNLVTLEENLKENISSRTLLVFKEPSFLLPPPKPPDECLKNDMLNEDFYQSKKTLPLNVEDVNSFTFIIWTFLPYFTYTKESPLIFSFRSENFVFDPGIVTCHKPVRIYQKSQENRQERANLDTRNERAQKKPEMQSQTWRQSKVTISIHPSSLVTQGKSRGFSQLKGTEDNSRARLQDGRERLVKSSFSLTHSQAKATWLWKKAQGEIGFTLGSHREVTQGYYIKEASLAIVRSQENDLDCHNPWIQYWEICFRMRYRVSVQGNKA
ncbi:reverse transcriptase domain-containing protein [Tanacetum coccineum]